MKPTPKFLNVSTAYDIRDIRHADHAGMLWTFSNGNTWLTLKDKRLFLLPTEGLNHAVPGPETEEDWPIMGPDELKKVLASGEFPFLEELEDKWKKVQDRLDADPAFWARPSDLGSGCDKKKDEQIRPS
ncbi:hypothetical protein QBC47DRAFT_378555 [Echria macrotheca]|uniref:Uncharacterized protein n=1 Tax=Echria macrotheca TaxID=438768 RepID=A0AAJ0BF75_9PEZI|nr:hypothetical protein QBC47DRAFT_378555 [Echria macrotheca]